MPAEGVVETPLQRRRRRWREDVAKRRERWWLKYQELIQRLGGQCARCEGDETAPLSIDHVGGTRKWSLHAENPMTRTKRYWEEFEAGVPLRVLCLQCNTEDRNVRAQGLEEAPF